MARFLEQALKVSERSLPADSEHLRRLSGHLQAETSALSELRRAGATAQAEALAKGMASRLHEALATAQQAISRLDKAGIAQPAHTVAGRLDQARRWLEKPTVDDRGLGRQAVALVIKEGKKVRRKLVSMSIHLPVLMLISALRVLVDVDWLTHLDYFSSSDG